MTDWIPCSERLPEDNIPVNITWVNKNPEPYYADIKDKPFTATGVHYKGKWFWYSVTVEDMLTVYGKSEFDEIDNDVEVIAWMPLPEPFEERKKQNEIHSENIFDERGAMRASGCIVDEDDEIIDVTSEAFVSALRKFLSYDAKPSKWIMNERTLHLTARLSELLVSDDGYYLFGLPIEIDNDIATGEVYLMQ